MALIRKKEKVYWHLLKTKSPQDRLQVRLGGVTGGGGLRPGPMSTGTRFHTSLGVPLGQGLHLVHLHFPKVWHVINVI